MSSLTGKLEGDVEISAPAEKFHGVICSAPSQLSSICPDVIQECKLLEGEWGELGSKTHWSYVHDGDAKVAQLTIESVDSTNNSVTYRVLGGDLANEFSVFKVKIEASQKDEGSKVHLTFNYIKQSLDVADPETLLELGKQVCKVVDAHLTQA
ncbi:Bet v I/Major latex protein - like 10 [Theobroma cacao]|nr:Bet v I/Major latex protein - like 10 [Theobroma cacao]